MHRQKLITRISGDDDNGGVERGGICSRWSPDASSGDYASDSVTAAPARGCRRKRGSCCFRALYGCDGYDGDGTVLPDCCGRAAVFGSRSFFTGISGRRRCGGAAAAAASLAFLLTVLLLFNMSSRRDRYTRSLVEIREKYSTTAAKGATILRTTTILSRTTAMVHPPASTSAAPVLIVLLNDFYFGERYARVVPGCTWRDENTILPCEFTTDQDRPNASDALA